jgi:1-deoxy-D-xylulose 5-phosphate reductoisomerase
VAYDFHRDKIMETACKNNLETLLSQVMQTQIQLVAITDENAVKESANELQELAANFGGEVI